MFGSTAPQIKHVDTPSDTAPENIFSSDFVGIQRNLHGGCVGAHVYILILIVCIYSYFYIETKLSKTQIVALNFCFEAWL